MSDQTKIESGKPVEWSLFFENKLDPAAYIGQETASGRTASGRVTITAIDRQEYLTATTMEDRGQRMPRGCVRGCWQVFISGVAK